MTYGHDMNTAVIPLMQTVFFPKDAVGVKQIERFSARVFPEDLIRHADSIWLNGRYEIHLDYYGIEGKKLYKNRVDLPLKVEMPTGWQETDENNIDVSIDCRKLDVLAPYVLEFSGRIAVNAKPAAAAARLAMERADAEFEASREYLRKEAAEAADFSLSDEVSSKQSDTQSNTQSNTQSKEPAEQQTEKKSNQSEKYQPDPLVREVLAEYEEQTGAKSFGKKQTPSVKTDGKMDDTENKKGSSIKTVADLTAEPDYIDLKSLKSRTMLKLKKHNAVEEEHVKKMTVADLKAEEQQRAAQVENADKANQAEKAEDKAVNTSQAEPTEPQAVKKVSANDSTVINLPELKTEAKQSVQAEAAAKTDSSEGLSHTEESAQTMAEMTATEAMDESADSVEASAPDLALTAAGMDFGDLPDEAQDTAPIVFTAELDAPDSEENAVSGEAQSVEPADNKTAESDGRIVAASGLTAHLKMVNSQSTDFIEKLANLNSQPYYLKYGKVQAGDGEAWQRTE